MKTLDYDKIEYYKNNKFNLDIGRYFNQSLELFQNNWQPFVVYALVAAIIYVFASFTLIGLLFVMFPLLMGFLIGAERAENKMSLELGDFFTGFKNIGSYLGLILIVTGVTFLIFIPFFFVFFLPFINTEGNIISEGLLFGVSMFSMLYFIIAFILLVGLQIATFFSPYLIHYGNMGAIESIKVSYALVKKSFGWILLMILIIGFIASIGSLACYIGAVVTYPIAYIMKYYMLKDMILTDDTKTEIDLLGTNQE